MAVVTGPPALEVRGVSLRFGGIRALTDVSLHVEPGELLAIIGPNGAGKTSVFNVISGLYAPAAGSVHLHGQDVTSLTPPQRVARGVGRTFQNIELFPLLTVIDNVLTGRHRHLRAGFVTGGLWFGRARQEEVRARRRAEEIIEFLEIEAYRNEPVASLPYGIQKRVELGRALAVEPEVLLLDEPVAGMNSEETEDIGRLILDIREEFGITQLLVEHDLRVVMDLADRVVVLNFGEVLAAGAPDDVRQDERVAHAYLGSGAPPAAQDPVSLEPRP